MEWLWPRGSILGPTFLLYISDLVNKIHEGSVVMYADDTVIYSGSNIDSITDTMQTNLEFLAERCNSNRLTVNTPKTKIMLFGRAYKLKNVPRTELKL